MPNKYPSGGQILYLSIAPASFPSGNAEMAVYPLTPIIPDGSYSLPIAVNTAEKVSIQVKYNDPPTSPTIIQYGSDPKLLDAITLDTIPLSATDEVAVWFTEASLNGFLRVFNDSDKTINEVRAQLKVRKD